MRFSCRFFGPERTFSIGDFASDIETYLRASASTVGGFDQGLFCNGPDHDIGDQIGPGLDGLLGSISRQIKTAKHDYRDADGRAIGTPGDHDFGPFYVVSATNSTASWDEPSYLGVSFAANGFQPPIANDASIVWTFHPDGTGHQLRNAASVRALIRQTVEHRQPTFANCTTASFRRATGYDRKLDKYDIGWLTYFGEPGFKEALRSVPDVEDLGKGVLVQVCDSFQDLRSPAAIARGTLVRQALLRSGLMTK